MASVDHAELAQRLRHAYGSSAVVPMRDGLAADDATGAYDVQSINTSYWLAQGRRIVGRKIGLTSAAVQAQLGVEQPDHGVLFDDMRIADGGRLPRSRALQPRVEGEVAIILGRDLDDPATSMQDVIAATAYVLPAIEIVDSRIAAWEITYADTVADNASAGFFVLGTTPRRLPGLDLRTCGMALDINGRTVSMGAGVACLGHPLKAAAWAARALSGAAGGLKAGDIVLTGALGPMVALSPGDAVQVAIGGLGGCGFHYVDDHEADDPERVSES